MATFPINVGHPDYSGKLIPQIWARKFLDKFYDASVLPAISQTDYEGEIRSMGDKVTINRVPTLIINDYKMGDTLNTQRPEAETIDLLIDQGHYWQFILDDVADAQALTSVMPIWADDASEQLKITVDSRCLAFMVGKAKSTNRGATAGRISANVNLGTTGAPVTVTKATVLDYIVDHGQVLDEENVPENGRKMVIPAWMAALIKKSDLKDASLAGDGTSILRNGRLGMIDRFELYTSNLLPKSGANTYIYATHPKATTFAAQLTKTETLRAESTFGELMRGLMVYGREVVLPQALTEGVVVKG
jgi:multimeric flavodoxin WrbA